MYRILTRPTVRVANVQKRLLISTTNLLAETPSGKAPGFPQQAPQTGASNSSSTTAPSPTHTRAASPADGEAAALAIQSIKDIGSILSSSPPGEDDETQPIDSKPVWENPALFGTLSLLHQGQVQKELQEKFDRLWHKLSIKDKKLGYYMAYGNWGVREEFDNWKSAQSPPLDLPFTIPLKVQTLTPSPETPVHKTEPAVVLAETAVRKPQFDTKKIDPVTKFFLYMIVFVAMLAIHRDKTIGEEGRPVEQIIADPYEELRKAEARAEAERQRLLEEERLRRKWYYLWLR